jgi:predicted nucleotidyltransferase
MSANGYLTRLADSAFTRQLEKENIERSFAGLRSKIDLHFNGTLLSGKPVKKHFPFGSYTRGTMLPRSMDPQSDIDYMIVFSDTEAKPQAYLDRLLRFAEARYPRSEIAQSSPTIVLELNHIRFELVPAIEGFFSGLKIPSRANGNQSWMDTDPTAFNQRLIDKNKSSENLIKPLVRVLKYWNAQNSYPFESYSLEQLIVGHSPLSVWLFGGKLWDWFASFVEYLSPNFGDPEYKKRAIERAKTLVAEIKSHESRGEEYQAQQKLERLLPPVA